mmetsp:Transcript_6221/g.21323  ORF Transcript_6221/g.21323 Transcript_6221/m.21323 type:complete len:271 (-) Transcript_6221:2186-2998(-)
MHPCRVPPAVGRGVGLPDIISHLGTHVYVSGIVLLGHDNLAALHDPELEAGVLERHKVERELQAAGGCHVHPVLDAVEEGVPAHWLLAEGEVYHVFDRHGALAQEHLVLMPHLQDLHDEVTPGVVHVENEPVVKLGAGGAALDAAQGHEGVGRELADQELAVHVLCSEVLPRLQADRHVPEALAAAHRVLEVALDVLRLGGGIELRLLRRLGPCDGVELEVLRLDIRHRGDVRHPRDLLGGLLAALPRLLAACAAHCGAGGVCLPGRASS